MLPDETQAYFAGGDGIHLMFNFWVNQHLWYALASGDARPLGQALRDTQKLPPSCQWAHFLRNHDELDLGRLTEEQRATVFERFGPDEGMQLYGRGIRRRLAAMLGEHGEQTHGFFVYDAAVRIPLIVAGPGVPARVVTDQARIVDVMPTLLQLAGVSPPAETQGVSLMPLAEGKSLDLLAFSETWYPRYHYGWSELVSVQDGRFKLIRAPRPELYDLALDPGELSDLSGRDPRRTAGLRQSLEDMAARVASAKAVKGPQAIDAETAERLEALGVPCGAED